MSERTYRRAVGTRDWHFSEDCSHWPIHPDFYEQKTEPDAQDLCLECQVKVAVEVSPTRAAS